MIRVLGNLGYCINCEITKKTLNKKGIEFKYEIFDELPEEEQNELKEIAVSKGLMKMPLIIKDNELVTLQEL